MNEIITIDNVRGYIDENNTAYLNAEDITRGFGFSTTYGRIKNFPTNGEKVML